MHKRAVGAGVISCLETWPLAVAEPGVPLVPKDEEHWLNMLVSHTLPRGRFVYWGPLEGVVFISFPVSETQHPASTL